MDKAEPRQQGLAHQLLEGLAQRARSQIAEQTYAGVGVLPLGTGGKERRPLAVVGLHLLCRVDRIGELQGQAASTVGGKIGHGHTIKGRAFQPGCVLAHLVIQLEAPLEHSVGAEGRGQGLADRADFKQGLLADALTTLPVGNAIVEVVGLAIFQYGNRHSRDPVLLEHGLNGAVHDGGERSILCSRSE